MEFKYLLLETNDGVTTLTINRPEALNALNSALLAELECAFASSTCDAAVKVVVITGAGEKAFVAGADIKEMSELSSFAAHAFMRTGQRVMLFIEKMKKPVIAAVNGFALGGGLELALACDFIYASEKAKLGLPEVGLGIMPGFGGTQNLARLIGPNKAKELIFTGKMITAQKALAWGIVNEVFAPDGTDRQDHWKRPGRSPPRGPWESGTARTRRQRTEHGQGGRLPLRGVRCWGCCFRPRTSAKAWTHLLKSGNRNSRANSQQSGSSP